MTPFCIIPNCGQPKSGRSNKCNAHKLALRRHGHPLQSGIKVTEYGPYRDAIRRLWDANEDAPLWQVMRARWGRCIDHAKALTVHRDRGGAYARHEVRAADALLALDCNVAFQEVASTALALYVYAADRPHRFADDQALRFQLVRKVRALDELAVGKTWNHKTRAMHRVYQDMPPRAVRVLADYLGAVFAEAGLRLRDHAKARPKPRLEVTEAKLMAESVRSLR